MLDVACTTIANTYGSINSKLRFKEPNTLYNRYSNIVYFATTFPSLVWNWKINSIPATRDWTPMASSIDIAQIRNAQRAQGPATILAIGTATPSNCVYQADYPDYYFRITKSEHMVDLKEKFQRMCMYLLLLPLSFSWDNTGQRYIVAKLFWDVVFRSFKKK